jgi:hypothetical protein
MIALIIHPKNETGRGDSVKWDEEYTLVVSDWYHRQHYDLLEEFMSWKNPTGAEPVPGTSASAHPASNPIGRYDDRGVADTRFCCYLRTSQRRISTFPSGYPIGGGSK